MNRLVEQWRERRKRVRNTLYAEQSGGCDLSAAEAGLLDGAQETLGKCADELESYLRPRPLATEPPTKEDEHGEILVKTDSGCETLVWRIDETGAGEWATDVASLPSPALVEQYGSGATWRSIE